MPATEAQIRTATARLRHEADALLVLVIMPEHVIYSVDRKMQAVEVERVLQDEAATVADHIKTDRKNGRCV